MPSQNVSGTITTGGTAQTLVAFPAGARPRGFWIQNLDDAATLYIRGDGQAATAGVGSIVMNPGDLYETPHFWPVGNPVPSVSVFSTKTGHAFSAEWF
ncbi:MAG: hypothetical protein AAB214_06745 [Fibrobacterota bacterium]